MIYDARMSRSRPVIVVLVLAVLLSPRGASAQSVPGPSAARLLDAVKALSSPAMVGRRSGTPGAARAARFIAQAFEAAGLAPGGDAGGWEQTFQVPTGIRLGTPNSLA